MIDYVNIMYLINNLTVNLSKQRKWFDDIDKRTESNQEITKDGGTSL